jgi:hypothetical protein
LHYHPDKIQHLPGLEQDKNVHYLQLANDAFNIIEHKCKVNQIISNVTDIPLRSRYHNSDSNKRNVYTSSYSYSNINGESRESGTINGRAASSSELNALRAHGENKSIFYNLI